LFNRFEGKWEYGAAGCIEIIDTDASETRAIHARPSTTMASPMNWHSARMQLAPGRWRALEHAGKSVKVHAHCIPADAGHTMRSKWEQVGDGLELGDVLGDVKHRRCHEPQVDFESPKKAVIVSASADARRSR
jgi:hypothetical protein